MSKKTSEIVAQDGKESKRAVPAIQKPLNMMEWIENNKDSFVPPVCNKLMYGNGQLKIMFVGGPNTRKDYHIEEGEELFFQIKGDMCLKVLEKGKPKDIPIKEGEIFRLPSRIHHSPQRFENTVGLVIERERLADEYDGLRYFCEDGVSVLWEKWFHCEDLGTQLSPIIKDNLRTMSQHFGGSSIRYFSSEPCKTGNPDPNNIWDEPPLKVDTETELKPPISFKQWVKDNQGDYENSSKAIFDEGEFKVIVYGAGEQTGTCSKGEMWLWQMEGEASVTVGDVTRLLEKNKVIIIPEGSEYKVTRKNESVGVSITMDPEANK